MSNGGQYNNTPLTAEQQAVCVQWRRLALHLTHRNWRRWRPLRHHQDEVESVACVALVYAARAWRPADGSFGQCLGWWVRRMVHHAAYTQRTVRHPETAPLPPQEASLDAPTGRRGEEDCPTLLDGLADNYDVEAAVDAERVVPWVRRELIATMRRRSSMQRRLIPESVDMWLANRVDGVTMQALGAPLGIAGGGISCRLKLVQRAFDAWARGVREEAA